MGPEMVTKYRPVPALKPWPVTFSPGGRPVTWNEFRSAFGLVIVSVTGSPSKLVCAPGLLMRSDALFTVQPKVMLPRGPLSCVALTVTL